MKKTKIILTLLSILALFLLVYISNHKTTCSVYGNSYGCIKNGKYIKVTNKKQLDEILK